MKVIALCKRFLKVLRHRVSQNESLEEEKPNQSFTVKDLEEATSAILKNVQERAFPEERDVLSSPSSMTLKKSSPLYKLDPFMDDNGLLRVGGRLSGLSSFEQRHPIILPYDSRVSELVVRHYHSLVHQGRGYTMNTVREAGYWIINLRRLVSSVINSCVNCRRYRGKLETQKMAPLPECRTEETPPFTYVGVDYFGPFTIRQKRSDLKRYGVLLHA